MKLLDAYISGFGKFHDLSVTFSDGLNVVYGKNEAGKSTLHTFIRGMLFGIERGRGRAAKGDLYNKYEPWENSGNYEGRLRLESDGTVYRIERNFYKNARSLKVINETLGREETPDKAFYDRILCGLTEVSYNNTISISQLKSATDSSMVSELKNYIANLNTSGNMALNITKAADFLKNQKKGLEAQIVPEAARSYTSLCGEIRTIENEISSPEYENQLPSYQKMRTEVKSQIEKKRGDKEVLIQKIAKGHQVLSGNHFSDEASIAVCLENTKKTYEGYKRSLAACSKKSRTVAAVILFLVALAAAGTACYLNFVPAGINLAKSLSLAKPMTYNAPLIGGCALFLLGGILLLSKGGKYKRELAADTAGLQEAFSRHLGDSSISDEAMAAFSSRMAEFTRLCSVLEQSEKSLNKLTAEIDDLEKKESSCGESIEKQQRSQWELEKRLEQLDACRDKAEALKHVVAENDRLRDEIAAIDLAIETMTELSTSIRASFGLHLNKAASDLISGITGGIYDSMSVDENLNVFMNTKTKLVPIEQVSSGTMDQIYLALRLAVAKLMNQEQEPLPLIFDDSFVQYDDDRLKTALVWLTDAYEGQIVIFTCHQRELQILNSCGITFNQIKMGA